MRHVTAPVPSARGAQPRLCEREATEANMRQLQCNNIVVHGLPGVESVHDVVLRAGEAPSCRAHGQGRRPSPCAGAAGTCSWTSTGRGPASAGRARTMRVACTGLTPRSTTSYMSAASGRPCTLKLFACGARWLPSPSRWRCRG
jgi:hypothetical protein